MSIEQKQTIAFIANTFVKVLLGISGALLTLLYVEMRSDVNTVKQDINKVQVDMATIKGYIRYNER